MLVSMLCALIFLNAYPQNNKVDKEVNLSPVVVTGTGTHHRQTDSPVPVQVITQQDLLNINVSSLEEALQKLNPSFTHGMGTTLSLNGLSDEYYVFLLNGRRLTGDDTYAKINLSSVKRIEIQNGAASTLYGTNAIGGVVNIITEDASLYMAMSNLLELYGNANQAMFSRNSNSVELWVNGTLVVTVTLEKKDKQAA